MTTKPTRPCQAKNPSECAYHGAPAKMEEALARNDISEYLYLRLKFEKAADAKFADHELSSVPKAPEGASYGYTGETMTNDGGVLLYRIKATKNSFSGRVKEGDLGGWVDPRPLDNGEPRISGNAWITEDAQLYGNAWISDNARISGRAQVSGDAHISGIASVSGDAHVSGKAQAFGNSIISENAWISGGAQVAGYAIVSEDAEVSGYAIISENAQIYGKAQVSGNAKIGGRARIRGYSRIHGNAEVSGVAQIEGETISS